ncbi:MAG TPA: CoA transferase [Pseudolabrys sp.]|nr:CoA transferase [Pseudolabrys sp.]
MLLNGLRVLAVEQYGAGPFGTQALVDLGAEIIKIENLRDGGDVTRSLGPYFDTELGDSTESLFFQALNRGKKSIAIDLSTPDGQKVFHALVHKADAVTCNLRGDVPGRLGLTYAALGQIKPDIVCCHLTAYGRDGSRAAWPAYDYIVQAETGYFSLNGEPDTAPSRFGLSIVDYMAGYCLALSIVSGVLNARTSSRGRDIDVSLYDVALANLNYLAVWALNANYAPQRLARSAHPTVVPCQLFQTADGWIYIMANKEKFFPLLCAELGAPELAEDPRFRRFPDRHVNRQELSDLLDTLFGKRPTTEWIKRLAGKVPAAPVASVGEALATSFTAERTMVSEVTSDSGKSLRVLRSPIDAGDPPVRHAAPALGRDTADLLTEAGLSTAEIDDLKTRGIVR